MTTVPRLALLFWRRGGARQRVTLALTAAGVLTSVVLALLAISVGPALADRGDRIAWRDASRNVAQLRDPTPRAAQQTSTDEYAGSPITRVDLAPVPAAAGASESADVPVTLPVPPGLDRFPAAGEVWVSPALGRLLASVPADELADRFPGAVVGTIGPEGLAHAEELVAVVGRAAGDLVPTAGLGTGSPLAPISVASGPSEQVAAISGFASEGADPDLELYRTLAQMAAVLLVVPTLLLVGAAARLTAAQREQRLAALRLAGATPGSVVGLTALEIGAASLLGAVLGLVAYAAVLPLAARIPLAGGPFSAADLRLPVAALVAAAILVPVAAAVSAAVALRQVVVGPLGVSRRTRPRRPSALRFLVVPVAWVAFVVAAMDMSEGGSSAGALLGLGAVIATLAVMGPWVTWTIGAVLGHVARRPATLIAARRIGDDPKAAYRTISGMVLAGLIAGFLFAVIPTIQQVELDGSERTLLSVELTPGAVPAVRRAVAIADPKSVIGLSDPFGPPLRGDGSDEEPGATGGEGDRVHTPVVASSVGAVDRVRTAIVVADPGAEIDSAGQDGWVRQFLDDLGRASVVMALASLLMATAATAIGATSSILDQRVTLARLRLVGTPLSVLQRARRWQTLVPLVAASVGALGMGATAGLVMLGAFAVDAERIQTPDVASMAVLSAAAIVAGLVVVAGTRPVLASVSRSVPRD